MSYRIGLLTLVFGGMLPLVVQGQQPVPIIKNTEVTATVSFEPVAFRFSYEYAVTSLASNTGNVRSISIDITTDLTRTFFIESSIPEYKGVVLERLDEKGINILPVETTAPPGWDSVNLTVLGTANWGGDRLNTIQPGESLGGFTLTSQFVPGIRTLTISPQISTWNLYPDANDPEEVQAQQDALIKSLDFVGQTLGPVGVSPGTFAHWNQLRDDLNRAIEIGWITNAALGTTLVAQLADAREALEQLSGATAKERLQIVLDTLAQAAAGDLRSEARELIRLNAEVLIARTPDAPVRFEPKLSLTPEVTELPVGGAYTLNAKLVNVADLNRPVADFQLNFQVLNGPHEDEAASVDTDDNGEASFGFIGTKLGTDKIEVVDRSFERVLGKARVTWTGGPDLVIPLFVPPFIESKGGNTFFITDTTANIGSTLAGPSTTGFFLSETPPPFDITTARFIGERAVPQLAPNEKNTVQEITFTIPNDLPAGTYHLVGCADTRLEIVELDEDNNCSFNPVGVLPSVVVGVRPVPRCDVNEDGNVDRNDIGLIMAARNTPANGPNDPRDADGNGTITVLDARQCVLQCTNQGCAP